MAAENNPNQGPPKDGGLPPTGGDDQTLNLKGDAPPPGSPPAEAAPPENPLTAEDSEASFNPDQELDGVIGKFEKPKVVRDEEEKDASGIYPSATDAGAPTEEAQTDSAYNALIEGLAQEEQDHAAGKSEDPEVQRQLAEEEERRKQQRKATRPPAYTVKADQPRVRELARSPWTIVAGGVALLIVIVGVVVYFVSNMVQKVVDSRPATHAYYVDLVTKDIFVAKIDELPPIPTPAGSTSEDGIPAGARAYMFSCGVCNDEARFVGWVEILVPEAREALQAGEAPERVAERLQMLDYRDKIAKNPGAAPAMPKASAADVNRLYLVASADLKSGWKGKHSDEGKQIMRFGRYDRCTKPIPCQP